MRKILIFTVSALLLCSCNNRHDGNGNKSETTDTATVTDTVVAEVVKPIVNVYIENSGSMDGYVKGVTEFENAVYNYLSNIMISGVSDSLNLFYINSIIIKYGSDIEDFIQKLEPTTFKQRGGNRGTSDIANVLGTVLNETGKNQISILVTDGIFSPGRGEDAEQYLVNQQIGIKRRFAEYLGKNKNAAVIVYQLSSNFNGTYYNKVDAKIQINKQRPYYICVIGNQDILNDFNKHIELKADKIEGFENKYTLLSEKSKDLYFSVLQSTLNKGRFKPNRDKLTNSNERISNEKYIHGIKDIDLQGSGGGCSRKQEENLQFAVAVDFSNVQAENDYLTNPANYTVTSKNFIITQVLPIDSVKVSAGDKNRISSSKPTHIIVLQAKTKLVNDVSFVLSKQMPQWIAESSTEDDTSQDKTAGKTFGLNYWVTGISEAYQTIYPDNKYFFECTISIDK
jgi:hypothetical protein